VFKKVQGITKEEFVANAIQVKMQWLLTELNMGL